MFARHCIITEEYSGLKPSGSIGTCSNGLANLLISLGYMVDVLITDLSCDSASMRPAAKSVGTVNFVFLADMVGKDESVFAPVDAITKSFCVYRYLRNQDYNVLHFHEWMGSGFYCAMARRQGLLTSRVVTHLHGSSEWVRRSNLHFAELDDFEREGIERSQIENSDAVICPSNYLLSYYRKSGISLPNAEQINWILPQWILDPDGLRDAPLTTRAIEPASVSELIFFGRHERRKGFELFIEAVTRLPRGMQPDLTFIGRFARIGHEFSGSHVFRKLPGYAGRIRFLDHLNQEEALARILHARNALCVIPSRAENSPCVLGECLTIAVPFLTTDVGGIAELIDEECRPNCVIAPTPQALAKALERCVTDGMPALRSSFAPKKIAQRWAGWLKFLDPTSAAAQGEPPRPLVSVCMAHYERPDLLRHAVKGLMAQTYDNIEIIIVDDASKRPDAHAYLDSLEKEHQRFPIKVVRSATNRYLGATRNLAASYAKGEYLLFHDDDNIAEASEIATFVAAAISSGCDILTSQCWVFRSTEEAFDPKKKKIEYYPIGIGGIFSFFRNRFGDANALFKRSVFESLGGFTELHGVGLEDWELFLRAFIRGVKMGVVPEPLFNYRVSPRGMLATGNVTRNFERIFALVDEERPPLHADLLRYAQRHAVQQQALDQLWADLEKEPAAELHQQLTAVEPGSPEARAKLSDLAFAIGRVADGIEIGVTDFHQREKILHLASHLSRPSPLKVGERTFVTPGLDTGVPAVMLRGWAFMRKGRAVVPRLLCVDDDWYETVAHLKESRPDVINRYRLESEEPVGFNLVATRKDTTWRDLARHLARRRRIGTSTSSKIEWIDPTHRSVNAYIDEIDRCREVDVKVPVENSPIGRIAVETAIINHVFLKNGNGIYVAGDRVSATRVEFDYSAGVAGADLLTFILPSGSQTDIIFESLD